MQWHCINIRVHKPWRVNTTHMVKSVNNCWWVNVRRWLESTRWDPTKQMVGGPMRTNPIFCVNAGRWHRINRWRLMIGSSSNRQMIVGNKWVQRRLTRQHQPRAEGQGQCSSWTGAVTGIWSHFIMDVLLKAQICADNSPYIIRLEDREQLWLNQLSCTMKKFFVI